MAMNYSDKVMEHFTNPQNVGEIENASGCGTVGNAVCGDIMRVYLDIDENNVIQDAKFKTFGCGAAIATSSMATVLVKGKTVQEALKVTNKAVMEALDGLPPVKVHCSLLAEEAIHAALWDYAEKNGIVIDENNVIQDAKFKTFGCGAAIATSSMATVLVKGKTVQEALKVTNKAVMEALDGLPPVKVHCSLLAEEAIHAALWDYAEKNGIVIEGLEKPVSDISEHDHGDEDDE